MRIGNINSYARLLHDSFSEIDNLLYDEDYNEIPDRFNRDSFKNLRNQFRREVISNLRKTDLWTVKEALIIKFNDFINEFENKYQTTVYDCNYHKNEELILSLYSCLKEEVQYVKWLFNDYAVDFGFCTGSGLDKLNDEAQSIHVEEDSNAEQVNTNVLANSYCEEKEAREDWEAGEDVQKQFADLFNPKYRDFVDNYVKALREKGVIENDVFTGLPAFNYLAKFVDFLIKKEILRKGKLAPILKIVYARFGWNVYEGKYDVNPNTPNVSMRNLRQGIANGFEWEEEIIFVDIVKNAKK